MKALYKPEQSYICVICGKEYNLEEALKRDFYCKAICSDEAFGSPSIKQAVKHPKQDFNLKD